MKLSLSSRALLAGLVALVGSPAAVSAQSDGSVQDLESEGAQFLLLPVGARTVGMGGAIAGLQGNSESVLLAPAGVAGLEDGRLFFNHHEGVFETRSEVLSFLWPTKSIGTFALTYYLVDFGEQASTGPDGSVLGTLNVRNQEFLITYGNRIVGKLEGGFSYKLVQLITRCDGACTDFQSETQTTHAFDLGLLLVDLGGLPLSLGGAVRNLGFDIQGENERDRLPTRIRLGAAYEALSAFTSDTTFTLAVAVDVEDRLRELGNLNVMIGSELGVAQLFYLRAGYSFLQAQPDGPTLGLGLTHDWFYVNLSRGFDELSSTTGEESIQVSFGVIF
jgi:hypothetical protein